METWALRPASDLARSLLRQGIDKENLPPKILKILRTRDPLLLIRTPPVSAPSTNRACSLRKGISSLETPIAAVGQAYDGRPVRSRCRLLGCFLGGVGPSFHFRSFLRPWLFHQCQTRFLFLTFCKLCYHYIPRRSRKQGHPRVPGGSPHLFLNGNSAIQQYRRLSLYDACRALSGCGPCPRSCRSSWPPGRQC
jgi:hypothetical protein